MHFRRGSCKSHWGALHEHLLGPDGEEAVKKIVAKAKESTDDLKDKMTERIFEKVEAGDSELKGRFPSSGAFRKAWAEIKVDPKVVAANDVLKASVKKAYPDLGFESGGKGGK